MIKEIAKLCHEQFLPKEVSQATQFKASILDKYVTKQDVSFNVIIYY